MKFTLSASQRKILQNYWQTGRPFSLDTVLSDRIFSFRFTARYSLWRMKRKNQIIQPVQGSGWYIATTDSSREWDQLHWAKKVSPFTCGSHYLNRFERAEQRKIIQKIILNSEDENLNIK